MFSTGFEFDILRDSDPLITTGGGDINQIYSLASHSWSPETWGCSTELSGIQIWNKRVRKETWPALPCAGNDLFLKSREVSSLALDWIGLALFFVMQRCKY